MRSELENPRVTFKYPEAHFRKHYKDCIAEIKRDLQQLKVNVWFTFGEFSEKIDHFMDSARDPEERQDDVELLAIAAFIAPKRIKRILTLDLKFINRFPKIHNRVRKDPKLHRWVLDNRQDFFSIEPCLPSQLLQELGDSQP